MHGIFPATDQRLAKWAADPNVLGVLLVGSKSRGHHDELSDDDLEVLLTEEAFARRTPVACGEHYFEGRGDNHRLIFDVQYTTLVALQSKALSSIDLDRWPYEQAKVLFDRGEHVAAAGHMDPEFRHVRLQHAMIDAWVAPRRAAKTIRRGAEGAGRMIVARGAKAFTRLLFALEWRWVPLDHWLEAELRTLDDPAGAGALVVVALRTGAPAPLEAALTALDGRLADEGMPLPDGRRALFYELLHPSRAAERAVHGLP